RALDLADQVQVIHGDGYDGHPQNGLYDRIIVTCGIAGIPPHWLDQLADGGMILAPLAHAGVHPIFAARRADDGELSTRVAMWGDFMQATGNLRPAELFHHNPADDLPAEQLRPVDGTGTGLTATEYNNLWVYLGTADNRITRAYLAGTELDPRRGPCALVDSTDGAAWIHHDGGVTLAGAEHLRDRLMMLVGQWEHLHRPAVTAWTIDFRHADTGAAGLLLPHRWHLSPTTADPSRTNGPALPLGTRPLCVLGMPMRANTRRAANNASAAAPDGSPPGGDCARRCTALR
ncbi:MAG: protein-L-isoaspartate O-methyltransferase family protein, partial [Pseudonocardiaceae bacterium]